MLISFKGGKKSPDFPYMNKSCNKNWSTMYSRKFTNKQKSQENN